MLQEHIVQNVLLLPGFSDRRCLPALLYGVQTKFYYFFECVRGGREGGEITSPFFSRLQLWMLQGPFFFSVLHN